MTCQLVFTNSTASAASFQTVKNLKDVHAISMHGKPALPADYDHFPYVNPDAPKGGTMRYGVFGTFDSLNPFIIKGVAARGVWDFYAGYNVFESLLHRNRDEPFSLYGLLAEKILMDEERTFIEFQLNPKAKFSDGKAVTAEDVLFSVQLLGRIGRPNYRALWKKVADAKLLAVDRIRFDFNKDADREAPLILGMMPIFPKHTTDIEEFEKTSLKPMIGSGPYEVKQVVGGSKIVLARRKNYWARDLPVKRGFDNFDVLQFEYYRDQNTLFDAFKKGLFDVHREFNPRHWQKSYSFPALKSGDIAKHEIEKKTPAVMKGFIFNTRREKFRNKKIRQALTVLFDFQWVNKNLFGSGFSRTQSFWDGSPLSATGKPATPQELELLFPYKSEIDDEILDGTFRLPVSDGSGFDRKMLRRALELFKQAGYSFRNRKLVDSKGKAFEFELLIQNSKLHERLGLAWQQNVEKLGIKMSIRVVDSAQLERRKINFDFDVTYMAFLASFSPGAEQTGRWASSASETKGSFNLAGVKNPAIDAMINQLIEARTADRFHSAIRAYDRLLMNGYYIMPLYHLDKQWFALAKNINRPKYSPLYGLQYPTWWDARAETTK
ncbi:MAG: ABC transporter substrate-binding protein [Hyphomicrobiales bacterium]|nr:ABC transporter substrate-binding protein [Hyphomicrobiales bacterium]